MLAVVYLCQGSVLIGIDAWNIGTSAVLVDFLQQIAPSQTDQVSPSNASEEIERVRTPHTLHRNLKFHAGYGLLSLHNVSLNSLKGFYNISISGDVIIKIKYVLVDPLKWDCLNHHLILHKVYSLVVHVIPKSFEITELIR